MYSLQTGVLVTLTCVRKNSETALDQLLNMLLKQQL